MEYPGLMSETYQPLQRQAVPEAAAQPDYSGYSRRELRMAQREEMGRNLRAGWGHLLIEGALFAKGFIEWWYGLRDELDWEPDPHGVDPELDREEREAKTKLRAIQSEMALRRAAGRVRETGDSNP